MQSDVLRIKERCDVNKLTINFKKTKLTLYNVKPERLVLPNIYLDQDEIIVSYLTQTQEVKYNDTVSSKLTVKTGIGQGTILFF